MQLFTSTRLRLTFWYTLIIALVSLFFSLGIYQVQTAELTRFEQLQRERIKNRLNDFGPFRGPPALILDEELIAETKHRLIFRLASFDVVIIFLSAGLGYLLAGRTLKPIQQALEEQERFIGDASHELRTPLTALRTGIEVYLRNSSKHSPAAAKSLLTDNLFEVKKLQKLSDSLLTLTRANSDSVHHKEVNLKPLLTAVLKSLQNLAIDKKITLITRLGSGKVYGDPEQLFELFTILLDNAIKYTNKGGKIILTLSKQSKYLQVQVKDTGIGIAPSDLPHIFARFYRADTARTSTSESGGYGLGLAIAQSIVDSHHGTITVSSQKGKGATFTIRFLAIS